MTYITEIVGLLLTLQATRGLVVQTEEILVVPDGYRLRCVLHKNMDVLISWFKKNIRKGVTARRPSLSKEQRVPALPHVACASPYRDTRSPYKEVRSPFREPRSPFVAPTSPFTSARPQINPPRPPLNPPRSPFNPFRSPCAAPRSPSDVDAVIHGLEQLKVFQDV